MMSPTAIIPVIVLLSTCIETGSFNIHSIITDITLPGKHDPSINSQLKKAKPERIKYLNPLKHREVESNRDVKTANVASTKENNVNNYITKQIINKSKTDSKKRRFKRDEADEDIVIWDNCPGKLQYELIEGELKCVKPNDNAGLANRLIGPLEKCPLGTRRAVLPGGSYMCLKKRLRRRT